MFLFLPSRVRKTAITSLMLFSLSTGVWAGDHPPSDDLAGGVIHSVQVTDTMESVAALYGVSVEALKRENQEQDMVMQPGSELRVPAASWPVHQVQSGQTLWAIGKGYGISVEQLMQANELRSSALMPGDVLLLPRAKKPEWTAPVKPQVATSAESTQSVSTTQPMIRQEVDGTWVEVRLPDNRRAWVRMDSLVLGSWQPTGREHLITTARAFVGVPYKWGGTNPNGYDCSGFVQEVFRLAGYSVPRMADAQFEKLEKVEREELEPGDLVFFNTDGSGVSHVGIYSGNGMFLHASSSRGVIESGLEESYYATRYVGASRIEDWLTNPVSLEQ